MQREKEGDSVKIDLVIDDTSDPSGDDNEESTATEVICLRILSNKTKFRFNGMEITVKSPAFEVGKTFAVNLDQDNRLAGIETFKESYSCNQHNNHHQQRSREESHSASSSRSATPCGSKSSSRRVSLVNSLRLKPARIIVNSSDETEANEGLPLLSARLALEEDFSRTTSAETGSTSCSPTPSSPSSSFFRNKSKKKKQQGKENPLALTACCHHQHNQCPSSSRNTSPIPIHRMIGHTCSLSSPTSLSPVASPSPFRRTPSPSKISKLIGVEYEPVPGDPGYSQALSSKKKSFVSVGVGTTSNPKESLIFDLEGSFRRSRSWKK
jgi:hypothetical protein